MDIQIESPRRTDIAELLQEHLEDMYAITPPESVHALDLDGLCTPDITFWAARQDGVLVGCGALKALGPSAGEVKSMRTPTSIRRQGAGKKILERIIDEARSRQYRTLSLDTGAMLEFEPARKLYESFGFTYCGPFGDYGPDSNSVFMSLVLQDTSNMETSN